MMLFISPLSLNIVKDLGALEVLQLLLYGGVTEMLYIYKGLLQECNEFVCACVCVCVCVWGVGWGGWVGGCMSGWVDVGGWVGGCVCACVRGVGWNTLRHVLCTLSSNTLDDENNDTVNKC